VYRVYEKPSPRRVLVISLETEERDRVKQIGAEKLPAYTLDSLSKERLDEN